MPAGQTAITITIGLIDDGVAEGPETFIAQLSGQPGSATGAGATGGTVAPRTTSTTQQASTSQIPQ